MKKGIVIPILMLACLMFTSCGNKCNGYAPKGTEISWTDYNSVDAVARYFGYVNTSREHQHDTVRVTGYALGYGDTNYYLNQYNSASLHNNKAGVVLSGDPNKTSISQGGYVIILYGNIGTMEWLKDYKAGQKIRVAGSCYADQPMDDKGCKYTVAMRANKVELE